MSAFQEMGFKTELKQFSFEEEDDSCYAGATAIGIAITFGIDSFYTFIQEINSNQKSDHLTLFNIGAFGKLWR